MVDNESKTRDVSSAVGCVASTLLWVALLLHFFADYIWDEEPAVLKWGVIGYGCLVLLGLLASLAFGKRDEKIAALILLAVIAVFVAISSPRRDRQAAAAVDGLVRELAEKGTKLGQRADSIPEVGDRPRRDDLEHQLRQASEDFREQSDLLLRSARILARAPSDKLEELREALDRYLQQADRLNQKRDGWIKQTRENLEALKKAG